MSNNTNLNELTVAELRAQIAELAPELSKAELRKAKKADLVAVLTNLQDDEPEQEEEEQLTVAQLMSRKLREARLRYETTVAASGNASADNGDLVALALRQMEPKDVVLAAERLLDLPAGSLWAKYENLNPGQQRMNAGNRIRGAIKRGELDPEQALANLH